MLRNQTLQTSKPQHSALCSSRLLTEEKKQPPASVCLLSVLPSLLHSPMVPYQLSFLLSWLCVWYGKSCPPEQPWLTVTYLLPGDRMRHTSKTNYDHNEIHRVNAKIACRGEIEKENRARRKAPVQTCVSGTCKLWNVIKSGVPRRHPSTEFAADDPCRHRHRPPAFTILGSIGDHAAVSDSLSHDNLEFSEIIFTTRIQRAFPLHVRTRYIGSICPDA